eukprot:416231_1
MSQWNRNWKYSQKIRHNTNHQKPTRKKKQQQTTITKYYAASNQNNIEQNEEKSTVNKQQKINKYDKYIIVSGGAIGADQGVKTAGWAPFDFYTSNGNDISLKYKYGLKAVQRTPSTYKNSRGYLKRDRLNVDMSDIVIGFIYNKPNTAKGTLTIMRKQEIVNIKM